MESLLLFLSMGYALALIVTPMATKTAIGPVLDLALRFFSVRSCYFFFPPFWSTSNCLLRLSLVNQSFTFFCGRPF